MEVNFLAIAAAGLASWVLGALWYSPLLFGKIWQTEVGLSDEEIKKGSMPMIFGLSLILMIAMAFGLSPLIEAHGDTITMVHGFYHGCMIGLFFAATSMGINYLYQRRSLKLFAIDALYQVLFLGISGAVLSLF